MCADGYGGDDCMQVVCPGNTCHGHGECVHEKSGRHVCQCEDDFGSDDCSYAVTPKDDFMKWEMMEEEV